MTGFETSYRNRTCGELGGKDVGHAVKVCGWVGRRRDHGGLIFIDLRDRYGITQIVIDPSLQFESGESARSIRLEYVIQIEGMVERRPEGMVNPSLPTGEIEVRAQRFRILSAALPTPFQIEGQIEASEDIRLRYRYLDLRRSDLQKNLILKCRLMKVTRDFLLSNGFVEIETPILTRRTPEGARDYVVPSRIHPGKFYALPQSPQLYKQLLMFAGMDRYFQIARCFRDEDLRADRQPEFTQIDVEMSFIDEEDVMSVTEMYFRELFSQLLGLDLKPPFPRMPYVAAMERYGTDRPDLRFGMEIIDFTRCFEETGFGIFRKALDNHGRIRGLVVRGKSGYSRKELDELEGEVRKAGAKGIVWVKGKVPGWVSSAGRHLTDGEIQAVLKVGDVGADDLVLLVAGADGVTSPALDHLRRTIGRRERWAKTTDFRFLWVVEPPLFEISVEDGRLGSVHHPFTSPGAGRSESLEKDPLSVSARAYDIVLNGVELGGGSIRINDRSLQERVLRVLGMSKDEYLDKFGFLLEALDYGAPPHGGIALGMDRIAMMISGAGSLREVIAFPKTTAAQGLMEGSPSEIGDRELEELHIKKLDNSSDFS